MSEFALEIDRATSVSLAYRRFRRTTILSLTGIALLASLVIAWQLSDIGHHQESTEHIVFGVLATLLLVAVVVFSSFFTTKAFRSAEARQRRYRRLYRQSRLTEEKLRDSQRHLQLIADNLPVVIGYADRNERIRFANRTYGILFDDLPANITGMWLADVIGPEVYRWTKPYIDRALQGENVHFERARMKRSGPRIDAVTYIPDIKDGIVEGFFLLVEDITQRKREEDMLKLQSLVYENSSEAMLILESNGAILDVNPGFTELTGFALDEVRGKHLSSIASEKNDPAFFDTIRRAIAKTGRWQGEIWNRHKNGKNYLIAIKFNTVFNQDGNAVRRIALFADVTEKKANEEKIWRQANFDPLTGLSNRRMFHEHMRTEMKKSERAHSLMAIVFVDLDYFKEVNDKLGHACGDQLLQETARRLSRSVRSSDLVARLGGDEFIVLLGELADAGDAARIAEEIRIRVAEPFFLGVHEAHVSASIGIALYPADGKTIDVLFRHADRAMYAAKSQGRNRYHMWITH